MIEVLGAVCLLLLASIGILLRSTGRTAGASEEKLKQAKDRARLSSEAEAADRKARDRATAALHAHSASVTTIHSRRGSELKKPMSQEDADRLVKEARAFRGED